MTTPQDHDQLLLEGGGAAAAIVRHKERIAQVFAQKVAVMLRDEQQLSEPMTINTLPSLLTSIAIALSSEYGRSFASENSTVALQHGVERAKLTSYSLSQLIREYQILREILDEVLYEQGLSTQEWRTVHKSIDEAIAESASAFVRVHEGIREQFVATLTHDFRGPLSAAQNYLELIRRAGDKPEQRIHFVTRALENVRRVDRMINDLLDASRSHSGERLSIKPADYELESLVKDVLEEYEAREGDRFGLDCDGPIPVYGDCERIRQALQNLVENAIKYGSPQGPITVRLVPNHRRVAISVHNFGDPIQMSDKRLLFQAYQRTTSAEKSGKRGWGLGLVLVQAIAEAHGGTVLVESTADEGTTFTLDILQDVREWHSPREKQRK